MDLRTFNVAPLDDVVAVLRPCADVPEWIDTIARARPFATVQELIDQADTAARSWCIADVDKALAHHPRIGERARGTSTEAALSRTEQPHLDAEITEQLAAANAAYEARFGRVFLIRAAGRSAPEILAELQRRLTLSPDDEEAVAIDQLREIAKLRLAGAVR